MSNGDHWFDKSAVGFYAIVTSAFFGATATWVVFHLQDICGLTLLHALFAETNPPLVTRPFFCNSLASTWLATESPTEVGAALGFILGALALVAIGLRWAITFGGWRAVFAITGGLFLGMVAGFILGIE